MKNPIRYEMIVGVLDLAILEQDGTIIAYTRKTDSSFVRLERLVE
jgi:hypothetical protein